jgi:Tfp pilus assembly protein PilF
MAAVALALSALLFRGDIADAVVLRGDQLLMQGNTRAASAHYWRAMSIDASSPLAADRLIFAAVLLRDKGGVRATLRIADNALRARPGDTVLLNDRALLLLLLQRFAPAERDFARAAALQHSAQLYVFAGWAARDAGDRRSANALWRKALSIAPGFAPARAALAMREQ